MNSKRPGFFISGIGTEVGKTVASAILVKALKADYWKPVQAGDLENSDTHKIERWATHEHLHLFPERYRLNTPASPHYAAAIDDIAIQLHDFECPKTGGRPLIVEGAGGLMVPLNNQDSMINLIARLRLPLILVSKHYLGSINHSLLSIEAVRSRDIPLAGILFNGAPNPATEEIIVRQSGVPVLGHIYPMKEITRKEIALQAIRLRNDLWNNKAILKSWLTSSIIT